VHGLSARASAFPSRVSGVIGAGAGNDDEAPEFLADVVDGGSHH